MSGITLPGATKSQGTIIEQSRAVAEVAAAIQVAQQFPRSPERAQAELEALCSRLSIAEQAFYEVPNRGAGMSVHIARELARIWGNVDYGVRELSRDDTDGVSEVQAWAWDQETNARTTRSFIQPHERQTRQGRKKLTELNDIYLANQNTGARAVRECIFAILPGWLLADAEVRLRQTLQNGGGAPIEDRRAQAIAMFSNLKITAAQLVQRLGKPDTAWQPADVAELGRIYNAVTTQGIAVTEFFPEEVVTVDQIEGK